MTSFTGLPFCNVIVGGSNSNRLAVTLISTGWFGSVWLRATVGIDKISKNSESTVKAKARSLKATFDIGSFSSTVINQNFLRIPILQGPPERRPSHPYELSPYQVGRIRQRR